MYNKNPAGLSQLDEMDLLFSKSSQLILILNKWSFQ